MKFYRHAALAAIGACAALAAPAHAQTPTSIYSEQDKLIRADRTVGVLGADLFGDKVNFYNGTIEFTQTDVSIPGNNALPVSVGRRLVPGSEVRVPGLFADWDLDIPHLHGIFASGGQTLYGLGWSAQSEGGRCTKYSAPSNVNYQGAMWAGDEFWHGSFMYLPGSGSQEILSRPRNSPNTPADGNGWPLVTKSMAAIRCITNQQGGGEGFLAITPDGTQYRFDWLVSRTYPGLSKPSPLGQALQTGNAAAPGAPQPNVMFGWNVPRQEVWILPTLVTDRYGNSVTYTYNPEMPWQLQSITSSDGRAITLTYAPGTHIVTSVFDGTRTWTYGYGSDAAGGTLTTVTQPDNATWQFAMGAFTRALPLTAGPSTCDGDATANINAGLESGSMTHPSGAVGTFQTHGTAHSRSFVERQCRGDDLDGGGYAVYPRSIPSRSLVKKTISNASLPTTEWSYTYSALPASWSDCTGNCPDTKTTDVSDSRGVLTRYTFGNRFRVTEGQLQKVEVGTAANGFLRTTTTRYRAPDAGPYPTFAGLSPQKRGNGELASRYTPEDQRVITQQDVTFNWNASGFDVKARPTVVTRASSLGSTRTETTVFYDHAVKWVLGQTRSVDSAGLQMVFNEFDDATANLIGTKKFGRPDQTFSYNADGTLASRKDGLNQTTAFSNYKRGLARNASYADGTSESAEINDIGLITSVTDANGSGYTTTYGYDLIGRLNRITRPTGDPVAWNDTTLVFEPVPYAEYDLPAGHWRQTVATGNARTIIYFDALWRPRLTRSFDLANEGATAKTVLRSFDMDGRTTFESYPARAIGSVTASAPGSATIYDSLGRATTSYADSELGLLTSSTEYLPGFLQRSTNARGYATVTGYQAFDQPSTSAIASITAPEGVSVSIARDVFGKPTAITRGGAFAGSGPASVTRSYVYDTNQRLCKTVEPEIGATIQDYDAANNTSWRATGLGLTSTTSCDRANVPLANQTAFLYNERNRLIGTGFGDGSPAIGRTYTPDGLPLTVVSNGSTWVYGYNRRRLLTSETLGYGSTYNITRAYDPNGHPSALTYPDGSSVAYSPNALGEATQVGSYATGVTYHPNGAVAGYTLGNGIAHSLTQNLRGLPAQNRAAGVMQDQYTFDRNGNVQAIDDQQEGIASRAMTYDGLDRLATANSPGVWGNASYGYDALDNIRTSVVGSRSSVHNYDARNRLDTVNTNGAYTGYVYDTQGNITGRGTQGYYFDQGNRLQLANGVASYAYDGLGRRTSMTTASGNSNVQVYDKGGQLLYGTQQGSSASTTRYIYLAGKTIAKTDSVAGTAYLFTDALGSPVATIGNLTATLSYSCPAGWSPAGNNTCTQATSNTVPATVAGYTCPGGYTLSGSTCTLTTPTSSPASVSYSCPAGWSLSGSTCSTSTTSPATPVYSCPAGYTLSGSSCTGSASYAATGSWSCNGHGTLQAYANSPSGYKCIVQSLLVTDYPDPHGQCQSIAASMGLPLVGAPLRNNGKFMDCTMGPVTVYACPSGGSLSGSTCNTTVTQAASVSGYTCASGTLSGSSCISGSSAPATATYSCPAGQTLSGATCYGSSTTSTPGTPVYSCAAGYTLAGSSCTAQGSSSIPATASFNCPSGGTLSGATCVGAITRTRYEPYGNTAAGTVPSGLGFTGHVNDANTGLVYMQQRYYDPIAGRFLSTDPVTTDANTGGAFGRYHYAEGNPYRYTDPTGTEAYDSCWWTAGCEWIVSPERQSADGGSTPDPVGQADASPSTSSEDEESLDGAVVAARNPINEHLLEGGGGGPNVPMGAGGASSLAGAIKAAPGTPKIVSGETKFTTAGRLAHKMEPLPQGFERDVRIPGTKLRMDGYNKETKQIVEIKPANGRAAQRGGKQLEKYCAACDRSSLGKGHSPLPVHTYDPSKYVK